MPHHQQKIIISNFRQGVLRMIGRMLNKNARNEVKQYLITNKISISQSCVIAESLMYRFMGAILVLVSIFLLLVSIKFGFGNAWVSIPFFTYLISMPIIALIYLFIIPRGWETTYFKKQKGRGYGIKPECAKEFNKLFPDSYLELSSSQHEIINDYMAKKSLRKKISFLVLVYRNWTIILLCIVMIIYILAINDLLPF